MVLPAHTLVDPHTEVAVKARCHAHLSMFVDVLNPLYASSIIFRRISMMRRHYKFMTTRNLFWHIGADNKHKNITT